VEALPSPATPARSARCHASGIGPLPNKTTAPRNQSCAILAAGQTSRGGLPLLSCLYHEVYVLLLLDEPDPAAIRRSEASPADFTISVEKLAVSVKSVPSWVQRSPGAVRVGCDRIAVIGRGRLTCSRVPCGDRPNNDRGSWTSTGSLRTCLRQSWAGPLVALHRSSTSSSSSCGPRRSLAPINWSPGSGSGGGRPSAAAGWTMGSSAPKGIDHLGGFPLGGAHPRWLSRPSAPPHSGARGPTP